MTDLIIHDPLLAQRIQEIANRDNISPEAFLRALVEQYDPSPRPASSLTDADIDIPEDIQDKAAYCEAVRRVRPKLYRIARRYWAKVGDRERLSLTYEALDKVFWLIDHEGIPRFKDEKDQLELPPDPMDDLFGLLD